MEGGGTVFVLDGDLKVREQLSRIAESNDLNCEAFTTTDEFLSRGVHELRSPCCLVLELDLSGSSGIDLQEALNRQRSGISILFLTRAADIPTVVRAMRAGAFDYIQKPVDDEELLALISGALVVSARRIAAQSQRDAVQARILQLSTRERAVFELLANGKSNKEIAIHIGIGVPMVTRHRSKVFRKLGVCNIVQLLRIAGSQT